MHIGFMNVLLLYSDRRDSATQVSIFRVVSARMQKYV